jgi:hypothetical protein
MAQSGYIISSATSIQFTKETESDCAIPFLDVLLIRKGMALASKVYRKPTHNAPYLNFKSNHPPHVKRHLILTLHNRASIIYQEQQNLFNEINYPET